MFGFEETWAVPRDIVCQSMVRDETKEERGPVTATRRSRSTRTQRGSPASVGRWRHFFHADFSRPRYYLAVTMFSSLAPTPSPAHSAAELAALALSDERALRLPRFSANDAVTLGLSLRKRFRGTARHARAGAGALVGVYDALGHTLFACTVGDLAGHGDVGLEAWDRVKGMVELVRRTGHCTFYIEKGMQAVGKTVEQLGLTGDLHVAGGGLFLPRPLPDVTRAYFYFLTAFPLWLDNAPTCPIAIVVLHSGESSEDHRVRPSLSLAAPR
jgi:uncharacterized protein (UPF0303 family)